jgi:hypothetical protein
MPAPVNGTTRDAPSIIVRNFAVAVCRSGAIMADGLPVIGSITLRAIIAGR